jgi:hypothetical protein
MWVHVTFNVIVPFRLFEYVKLMEITIVLVLGNVEDECIMTFMKWKLYNKLKPQIWTW